MEKFIRMIMRRSIILDFCDDMDEYLEELEDSEDMVEADEDMAYLEELENYY